MSRPSVAALIRMVRDGKSDAVIAAEHNVSTATVASWRKRAGIRRDKGVSQLTARIIALTKAGKSDSQIAAETGLAEYAVRRRRQRAGLVRGHRMKPATKYDPVPAPDTHYNGRRLARPGEPAAWDNPMLWPDTRPGEPPAAARPVRRISGVPGALLDRGQSTTSSLLN